ncbi:MAG TPA: hypothetical protein VF997_10835 [Polyangia bacterium]
MANAGLFIGWNRPIAGREQLALELFSSATQFWSQQQAQGRIESFEPILLAPHAGDLNGFIFVRGERGKLNAIKDSQEFHDIMVRAGMLLHDLGCVDAHVGEAMAMQLQRFQRAIPAAK